MAASSSVTGILAAEEKLSLGSLSFACASWSSLHVLDRRIQKWATRSCCALARLLMMIVGFPRSRQCRSRAVGLTLGVNLEIDLECSTHPDETEELDIL